MFIDLRSDTVTKPSKEMMEFMLRSPVGDDVFDEDSTVSELEQFTADLFGKESGLFCPSGTMSNQIAIKVQTQPGGEVICESGAHVYYYEGGGIAFNSGCATKTISGNRGEFTVDQLLAVLRPSDVHFPQSQLVSIENTCNRGGGHVFSLEEIQRISEACLEHGLARHLDGARLFNALAAENIEPKVIGEHFDTISICLSKGLGAPVGSVLIGTSSLMNQAKRIRKVLGGGMRQAGIIAGGGLYALQHNVERLKDDHRLAKQMEIQLKRQPYIEDVLSVETNIVVFKLDHHVDSADFLEHLNEHNIKALSVGNNQVRFVTHLDLPENSPKLVTLALEAFPFG